MVSKYRRMHLRLGFRVRPEPGVRRIVLPFAKSLESLAVSLLLGGMLGLAAWYICSHTLAPAILFGDSDKVPDAILMTPVMLFLSGPLLMALVMFLLVMAGRDELIIRPGRVEIYTGIPGIAFGAVYDPRKMQGIGLASGSASSNSARTGDRMLFSYEGSQYEFGSNLDYDSAARLTQLIADAMPRKEPSLAASGAIRWEPPEMPSYIPGGIAGSPPAAPAKSIALPSGVALVAANVATIVGAVFYGWDLKDVVILYWAELAVVGFYTILKLVLLDGWFAVLTVPVFAGHFGGFTMLLGAFLGVVLEAGTGFGAQQAVIARYLDVLRAVWPALVMLFVSHGISFFRNFIGTREYERLDIVDIMAEPYLRVAKVQLLVMAGVFPCALAGRLLGTVTPALLLFMAAKVWFDLKSHLRERVGWGLSAKLRRITA